MRISKRNRKKGSALITTVLIAVLVCAMVTLMLSLSLYGQSLAKANGSQVVRQDRLDMLTSLFLEFGVEPVEDFGYDIQVRQLDNGHSLMVVRNTPDDDTCVMLVERDDGRLVKQLYGVYYPYIDYTPNRTVSVCVGTEKVALFEKELSHSDYKTGGPFRLYGKWKLENAVPQSGATESYAFVTVCSTSQSPVESKHANRLTESCDGWVNLKGSDGNPITFNNLSEFSRVAFGMKGMSGTLTVADMIIVNAAGEIVYSTANDPHLFGFGDLRRAQYHCTWSCSVEPIKYIGYADATWPVRTRDVTNYIPNRVVSIDVPQQYDQEVAKLIIDPKLSVFATGKAYTLTGRIRVNLKGLSATNTLPSYAKLYGLGLTCDYMTTGEWIPIVDEHNEPTVFYGGQKDDISFSLVNGYGTLELADIKIVDANGNVIYDMCVDPAFEKDVTYPAHVGLGGIWKPFTWEGEPSAHPFTVNIKVNPILQTHTQADYQVPVFAESVPNS